MKTTLTPELVVRYQRAAELLADAPTGGVWLDKEEADHVVAVIDELVELVRRGPAKKKRRATAADPLAELEASRKDATNG
jgi:hypothetical protein